MGEVWEAEQVAVRRHVAVKIIKAGMDTAQVVARFEAERQALALMEHPAIAKVFDAGSTPGGRPFFVMELVRGEPITTYCSRTRMDVIHRLELFLHVCEGVTHAHQKGVIHRDLKPSNILVTLLDRIAVPKIIDFGVAKATTHQLTDRTLFTEVGTFIGTPEFMSPEQAELSGIDVDTRSDVYSLGVVLYELLTGVLPFDGRLLREKPIDEIRTVIREVEPPRPSARVKDLHKDLDRIVMKALEKDRERRYGSVSEMAADIRRYLANEPVLAAPPTVLYRLGKFVRRHPTGISVGAILAVLLIAFAAAIAVQAEHVARERDRANREARTAERVADFLVALFRRGDPTQTRGRNPTARELVDNGASDIGTTLADQPAVQARIQRTLGSIYTTLGVYDRAETLLRQAVDTNRGLFGADHAETWLALNALGEVLFYTGRFAEAEVLYREVADSKSRTLGKEASETIAADLDLASTYVQEHRFGEAEALYQSGLERQERILGAMHEQTLATYHNMSSMYFAQNRYAEALPFIRKAADGRRLVLGADHPATLRSLYNLATTYQALRSYTEAEAVYRATITAQQRVLGDEHPDLARARGALAGLYMEMKRYDDAEPLAITAHETALRVLGPESTLTQTLAGRVISLYNVWGRPRQLAAWKARSNASSVSLGKKP